MPHVPQIDFLKKSRQLPDVEIFTLEQFYSRAQRLDFSIHQPHRVSFFHIIFITRGKGQQFIDFTPYKFTAGSLIFVSQGQVHAFDVNRDVKGFMMIFTEDFLTRHTSRSDDLVLSRLYNPFLEEPIANLKRKERESMEGLFEEIKKEFCSEEFAKEEMISLYLKVLLLKAERTKHDAKAKPSNAKSISTFESYRKLLQGNIRSERNIQTFAKELGITYKHLNEVCKAVTGKTAKACADDFLILELKRELVLQTISIKELAYSYHFDEPTNFVKFFKKHTSFTPSQFRKMQREKIS